ncbi:MAG: hypothetical protein ACRDJY_12030, partial [Thermoleophilaceae bacterium]
MRILAAALVLGALGLAGTAHADRPFSEDGVWNRPIASNPAIDVLSPLRMIDLRRLMNTSEATGKPPALNYKSWSTTVYHVDDSTPRQPLVIDGPVDASPSPQQVQLQALIDADGGVPFPAEAEPSDENDAQITVVNTDTGRLFEFFEASTPQQNAPGCTGLLPSGEPCHGDGRWHATTGGTMYDHQGDAGYFSRFSWPGLGPDDGWRWGATATSLPMLGGLITLEDLDSGVIDHALHAAVPAACRAEIRFPAQRNDASAWQTYAACMPEGARLQLNPLYNVNQLSHPLTRM